MKSAFFAFLLVFAVQARAEYSIGVASDYHAVRTTDTALTAMFPVGQGLIQPYFVMASTGSTSAIGLAANYKQTVSGTASNGFHVGGGLGLGTFPKDKSFFHLNGVIGFHFEPATHVSIHTDAGISVGSADSNSEVLIGGNSAILGLSLVYQL